MSPDVLVHSAALMIFLALFHSVLWTWEGVLQRFQLGLSNGSCSQYFAHLTICESALSITLCKGGFSVPCLEYQWSMDTNIYIRRQFDKESLSKPLVVHFLLGLVISQSCPTYYLATSQTIVHIALFTSKMSSSLNHSHFLSLGDSFYSLHLVFMFYDQTTPTIRHSSYDITFKDSFHLTSAGTTLSSPCVPILPSDLFIPQVKSQHYHSKPAEFF